MSDTYYQVAVDAPLPNPLTYLPLQESNDSLERGDSVVVPLGKRSVNAVVINKTSDPGTFKLKNIKTVDDTRPSLPDSFLKWLEWLSHYYKHPIGQVTSLAFPPLKKGTNRKSKKAPVVPEVELSTPPELTDEQTECVKNILSKPGFSPHLLFGVTGSGKTEVYLHVLDEILKSGKKGIVLVPEISLTPQLINRFSARFPGKVAVIHSHLTPREKTNQWWSVMNNEKSILIGARSALFCPIKDLGIVIVDEEHEPSFKQDEKLKYHGRDAAIMLAKFQNCPIILGSATPSLETWKNSKEGRYHLHIMSKRVSDRKMPEVHVVDMRDERKERKISGKNEDLPFWLSDILFEKLKTTLDNNQQCALFLNRRGIAQTVVCQSCGYLYECPNCAISLTLHQNKDLICHYCDYSEVLKDNCPKCKSEEVNPLGVGTELVENDIKKLFPDKVVARADRDEIQNRDDLEDLIFKMEKNEIDILVGTQMIAKGLDFPALTLVGLVMADVGFNLPDFRSSERSFQLLTQVSGRSGRHIEDAGQVVVQTYNPEHVSITYTQKNDFDGFAEQELSVRKELMYPPYGKLASLRVQGLDIRKVKEAASTLVKRAYHLKSMSEEYEPIQILGPTPSPLAKIRNKYRFLTLIKSPNAKALSAFMTQLMSDVSWVPSATKVQIDIDPINML